MSLREKLNMIAPTENIFPELSSADRLANKLLVAISNQICSRRKQLKKTQLQLATELHVSQPMVCQWESGDTNFTIETLAQIFDALNLDVDISFTEKCLDGIIPPTSQYNRAGNDASVFLSEAIISEAA